MNNTVVECDNCGKDIDVSKIELLQQIVSKDIAFPKEKIQMEDGNAIKKKIVAVRYYFHCPHCFQQYTCFYKDKLVNQLFGANRIEEAQALMDKLWELFENVN